VATRHGMPESSPCSCRMTRSAISFGTPVVNPPEPNVLETQEQGSMATREDANEVDADLKFLGAARLTRFPRADRPL